MGLKLKGSLSIPLQRRSVNSQLGDFPHLRRVRSKAVLIRTAQASRRIPIAPEARPVLRGEHADADPLRTARAGSGGLSDSGRYFDSGSFRSSTFRNSIGWLSDWSEIVPPESILVPAFSASSLAWASRSSS